MPKSVHPVSPVLMALALVMASLVAAACGQGQGSPQSSALAEAASSGGVSDLDRYLAIQEIKALKARYFRHLDEKDWDSWQGVFAPDAEMVVTPDGEGPGSPNNPVVGSAEIVAFVRPSIETLVTVHHGHMPEIEITSPTTATGIWAMGDIVLLPDMELRGWGHYHETYRKVRGEWKIAKIKLTRLRLEINGEAQAV